MHGKLEEWQDLFRTQVKDRFKISEKGLESIFTSWRFSFCVVVLFTVTLY